MLTIVYRRRNLPKIVPSHPPTKCGSAYPGYQVKEGVDKHTRNCSSITCVLTITALLASINALARADFLRFIPCYECIEPDIMSTKQRSGPVAGSLINLFSGKQRRQA